jgi:tRNA A37 threonylcarbamoyladenosine synthetase subunit TsaC/SUA5/YrdC
MAAARTGAEVAAYFPVGLDCILDAGPVPGEVGSTVVDLTGERPEILREGVLSREEIAGVVPL